MPKNIPVVEKILSANDRLARENQAAIDQAYEAGFEDMLRRVPNLSKVRSLVGYTPTIGLDGTLDIQYRPDPAFSYGLNVPGVFTGTILNRENIGKTSDELVAMWNEANPTDLVS